MPCSESLPIRTAAGRTRAALSPAALCTCRGLIAVLLLWYCAPSFAAEPLSSAHLAAVDRSTLEATVHGDVLALERLLATDFRAVIQVPTDRGPQTLHLGRSEFLLYAWQANAVADGYRVRPQPAQYRIAADRRSAVGVQLLHESLRWNGQPLRYTSRRTTHYRHAGGGIRITRLDVEVLDWRQP